MIAGTFANGIFQIIKIMGSDMSLEAPTGAIRPIRAAITTIGKDDGELINAVGIEGRVMYLRTLDPPPKKFDRVIAPNAAVYVIQNVHDIMVDNTVVGHKCVLKG